MGVAWQRHIPLAETGQQHVVQTPDRTGRAAIPHLAGDRVGIGGADGGGQVRQTRDTKSFDQSGDPGVVLGPGPVGTGEFAGQEGRQFTGCDAGSGGLSLRLGGAHLVLEALADRRELLIGQLDQPGRQREPPVEICSILLRDGALVPDVVLELGPGVLQHGADLDLDLTITDHRVLALILCRETDAQMPTGVTESASARSLPTHVPVVENDRLVGQQGCHRRHIAGDVGDDPQPDGVVDLRRRIVVERRTVLGAGGLLGEGGNRLRAAGHAQVVQPGVVENARHHVNGFGSRCPQRGVFGFVGGDGLADLLDLAGDPRGPR